MSRAAEDYRRQFRDRSLTSRLGTSAATQTLIAPKNSSHSLYIQIIRVIFFTVAAQSWVFNEVTSGDEVYTIQATPLEDAPYVLDFGEEGLKLSDGDSFEVTISGTGNAGVIRVEAYERLTPDAAIALSAL